MIIINKIIGRIFRTIIIFIPNWYSFVFFQKCNFFTIEKYWPNTLNPTKIKEIMFLNRSRINHSYGIYIDKYKVKGIIDKINSEQGINIEYAKLIQVVNNPKQIDFSSIDSKCFIKGTHGCGMNLFYDPNVTNKNNIILEATNWMNVDYYKEFGEMNYVGVGKKIIIEEYLSEELMVDVKVHCFKGQPSIIQIIKDNNGTLERKTYNNKWKEKNWFKNECLEFDLENMTKDSIIKYAKILSSSFNYVRIDFFLTKEKLYFAEFTFTPAGGHIPLVSIDIDIELYKIYRDISNGA